ncbi:hypothetical protein [Methylocystis sp.]|uniref:hypothetical protein n=1 Tax=Methylocystis sp. TaxID=1911079 RepID=UPI003D137381
MHNQTSCAGVNLDRNRDLQHRRDNQIRSVPLGGFDHVRAIGDNADLNFVPAIGKFDEEPLAEAIMS